LSAILDNCNGVFWTSDTLSLLWANVEDGLQDEFAEKWKIDGKALVKKLKSLSYLETAALGDAAERSWKRVWCFRHQLLVGLV
jgi:hypothetical protein